MQDRRQKVEAFLLIEPLYPVLTVHEASSAAGVSRQTARKWARRVQAEGLVRSLVGDTALQPRSRRANVVDSSNCADGAGQCGGMRVARAAAFTTIGHETRRLV